MDIKKINKLLEKYYEGLTSIEEEEQLRNFFLSEDLPGEMLAERDMFSYYAAARSKEETDDRLSSSILSLIKRQEDGGRAIKPLFRVRLLQLSGLAAGLAILLVSSLVLFKRGPVDTYEDPRMAYIEARKALEYVSVQLNRGTQPLTKSISLMGDGFSPLEKINEFNDGLRLVKQAGTMSEGINKLEYLNMLQDPADIISGFTQKK